jgi:hypothetical protein
MRPGGTTVGAGAGDEVATAPANGKISWAMGSFPFVSGVSSEGDSTYGTNGFSLQLNTNPWNYSPSNGPSICASAANQNACQGWEQFEYQTFPEWPLDSISQMQIQAWAINYGKSSCPSPWNSATVGGQKNCWRNIVVNSVSPILGATNVAHLIVGGRVSAGFESVILGVFGPSGLSLHVATSADVMNTQANWTQAEFNVFGAQNSSDALYNGGSTMQVQLVTDLRVPVATAPTCTPSTSFTGETNNLTIVPNSCCSLGGNTPGIQFTESNASGATPVPCAGTLSWEAACGRGSGGLYCSISGNSGRNNFSGFSNWTSAFSDGAGWSVDPAFYSTIHYVDVSGDGNADVCGAFTDGMHCAVYQPQDGIFNNEQRWSDSTFASTAGESASYYSTIMFGDINGDSANDVCIRKADGIHCAESYGAAFNASSLWQGDFSDANGWNQPQYFSTLRLVDVNLDGRADLCGRGIAGIICALSIANPVTGSTGFGPSTLWAGDYSDANGWNSDPAYYSTIQFGDINGDGLPDVCGRGSAGIDCSLNISGTTFGTAQTWDGNFSNAAGWQTDPAYYSTIRLTDVNGDGRLDVCGRGSAGIYCSTSTGTSFAGAQLWTANFSNAQNWNASYPPYYSTIQFGDVTGDGRADVCGWASDGIHCATSNGSQLLNYQLWDGNFGGAPWGTDPAYWSTIRLVSPINIAQ